MQVDDAVVHRATVTAAKRGTSVSGLVTGQFERLTDPTNAAKMPDDAPNERSPDRTPRPDGGTVTTFTAGDRPLDGGGLKPVSHECPDPAGNQGERSRLRSSCSSGRPSRSLPRPAYSFDAMVSSSDANWSVTPPTWYWTAPRTDPSVRKAALGSGVRASEAHAWEVVQDVDGWRQRAARREIRSRALPILGFALVPTVRRPS